MPRPYRSLPCLVAKGLECVFPIWFTQCGSVWFALAMPRPCYAPTMPFFSRPRHSTAVERRPVGYLPAFGFFRLPRGVPRRLLSEAYLSQIQVAIVKPKNLCHGRGKEWYQHTTKKDDLLNWWTSSSDISGYHADFHEGHGMGTACYVWISLKEYSHRSQPIFSLQEASPKLPRCSPTSSAIQFKSPRYSRNFIRFKLF